jgi:hypothetical protein
LKINEINSYKFARFADFVFSEVLTKEQFYSLKPSDIEILYKNKSHISYQRNNIKISNGSSIFCVNSSINLLFHYIKETNLTNLTLITNQTDDNISVRELKKLPHQFTDWYSINVDCDDEKLHPIPLGISNGYAKNLSLEDQFQLDESRYSVRKKNLLYISFADNTNIRVRSGLKTHFDKYAWTKITNSNNELQSYKQDLKSSNFILCPEGNGIDTHRVWEALYFECIPIIQKQTGLNKFSKLPILYVDNFYDITNKLLEEFLENLVIDDLKLIDFTYWEEKIGKNQSFKNKVEIKVEKRTYNYFRRIERINKKLSKITNGYFRFVYKIKNRLSF